MAADIHTEEYEVTTEPKEIAAPTRLYFKVKKKDTSGDDPVEEVYLRRVTSGTTRTGREDLEDATAKVNLLESGSCTDYSEAKDEIRKGKVVSYLSTRQTGVEYISLFSWS
jgi:hypothetical protein